VLEDYLNLRTYTKGDKKKERQMMGGNDDTECGKGVKNKKKTITNLI
jgi:hypothetical protein